MTASSTGPDRPAAKRGTTAKKSRQFQQQPGVVRPFPAAGAHAAPHLTNEDATPGAGVLPSNAYFGKEVEGAGG